MTLDNLTKTGSSSIIPSRGSRVSLREVLFYLNITSDLNYNDGDSSDAWRVSTLLISLLLNITLD